jgi:hypothetical protein
VNPSIQGLEKMAIDAHTRGERREVFWQRHGEQVREAEPWCRARFRRLYDKLMHLVCSGDNAGQYPPGNDPEPWLVDDLQSKPHDTITNARMQFPLAHERS